MRNDRAIRDVLARYVDAGALAGAVALMWSDGAVSGVAAVGKRDLRADLPVERDTIFRIASMTKAVTTVAALTMLDEGRFDVDEPITQCAPELARMRVLRDPEGPLDQTDEAARQITFRDLLTHRAGLTYGDFHRGPIRVACADRLGAQMDNPLSPGEWIGRLATLPLIDQPGANFHYGVSTDLLGFLIARLDGSSLGEVLERRVFAPLGMRDTGFTVPRDKRSRRAGLCGFDDDGRLTALTAAPGRHALDERPDDMTFESGGQGLWSTLDDYLTFARWLIGDATERRTAAAPRDARDDDVESAHAGTAAGGSHVRAADLCRGPRLRHGRRRGRRTCEGRSAALPRRCRNDRMAWRLRRLVAGRSQRRLRADIPHAQHGGAASDGAGIGLGVWSAIASFHELATA